MSEFVRFVNLLKRYKLVLIVVPVLTIILTFFLARNLPNTYVSQVQMSTGIADDKQSTVFSQMLQGDQVNQEFSNLIEMIKLKRVLDQVSYLLILNDLTTKKPFKEESDYFKNLTQDERKHAVDIFKFNYDHTKALDLNINDQRKLNDLLFSMKYDSQSISNGLQVFRSGNSDFLIIQSESTTAELSAFIANRVSSEFIKNYSSIVKTNQMKANAFLSSLLIERTDSLSKKMSDLRTYKIKNRVLNLNEQSKQLYTNIIEFDNQKQAAVQNTSSYAGALNEIDKKFSSKERKYIEATLSKVNQDIVSIKSELSALYEAYLKSDFESQYKTSLDSLQLILNEKIQQSSDQYLLSPLTTKQELVAEKLKLEVQLDISRYSIGSLERELDKLNRQYDNLVPKEADVQSLEMNVDIATKAYMDILNKYNASSLESAFAVKLNIIQAAALGSNQPSKKMLLVILSGIISFVFCLLIIFVIYYLDNSIVSAKGLADATQLPVLGALNEIHLDKIDLHRIWREDKLTKAEKEFKNELRSIRHEIENDVKGKVVTITSMSPKEGKSLLAISLAFAWKMTNHKVLIIDGNFNAPHLTRLTSESHYLEDFLTDGSVINMDTTQDIGFAAFLLNKGGDTSILELANPETIQEKLDWARKTFDIIIIETAPFEGINQAKEWFTFSDMIIGVFKSGQQITTQRKAFVDYLKGTGLFKGWVINKVPTESE